MSADPARPDPQLEPETVRIFEKKESLSGCFPEGHVERVSVLMKMESPAPGKPPDYVWIHWREFPCSTCGSRSPHPHPYQLPHPFPLLIPEIRPRSSQSHAQWIQFRILRILLRLFPRTRNRAALEVCDWNFAVAPVSSTSRIRTGLPARACSSYSLSRKRVLYRQALHRRS